MVTIGTLREEPILQPDGSVEKRWLIDIGATLDERIADGFYFSRSIKMMQLFLENPELLEKPLNEKLSDEMWEQIKVR